MSKELKKAADKLHASDLGETKDLNQLAFDKEKNSYEFDVQRPAKGYDHPLPYDTTAPNGEDSISTYDEANPYLGNEYDEDELAENALKESAMHIDTTGESVSLSPEDEILARTPEDAREDLDEEGYPKKDTKD